MSRASSRTSLSSGARSAGGAVDSGSWWESAETVAGEADQATLPGSSTGRPARVRRRTPPAWTLRVARAILRIRRFFRHDIAAWGRAHRDEMVTGSVSFVVHLLVALILAFQVVDQDTRNELFSLVVDQDIAPPVEEELQQAPEIVPPHTLDDNNVDSNVKQMLAELDEGTDRHTIADDADKQFEVPLDTSALMMDIAFRSGELGGRSSGGRRAAVQRFGGSADSEKAVNLGLKWLKSIQKTDGSWSFGDVGDAGGAGSMATTDMGATAMSLLCFLGAGHTHETDGPYKDTVLNGLRYLIQNAGRTASGADLRGRAQGNSGMYVQGIAAICLCEASAMSPKDKVLRAVSEESIRFIERAQDPVGGGWRYAPRQEGDTSVVGWQVMALQSARMGRIQVDARTIRDAKMFLERVESEDGARYGYMQDRPPTPSMTAVGLLCRMYFGWKRDYGPLQRGVEFLASRGPSREDIYYNYYATQVLHHFGGELWEQWNPRMRQLLVETQVKDGPGAGSWNVTDPHGGSGGRIYQTTLSILTLEVYYRHLPIYRQLEDAPPDPAAEKP